MAEHVVTEVLWAHAETGKAVRLEEGELSAARLGRLEHVSHVLTIPGQVFSDAQVAELGLGEFVQDRTPELRDEIHAAERERLTALRTSRISALRAELEALEADEEDV